MRINDRGGSRKVGSGTKSIASSDTSRATGARFMEKLRKQETDISGYEKNLQELKEEIDRAGKDLEEDPTITNFKKFRDLITTLVKKVSGEAYRLEKIMGTPVHPRCFEVITVINHEADSLYHLIMGEQKNRIAIADKIMQIRGLVISFRA